MPLTVKGSKIGDIMFELAKTLQAEKRRVADQYRLVDSLPRHHSWSIGRYRLTVTRRSSANPALPDST